MDRNKILAKIVEDIALMRREMMSEGHHGSVCPGMTYSELVLIKHIYESSGLGIKDIADKLCVSSSAVTQSVNKMIEKGYLIREDSPDDRRHLTLSLSEDMKLKYEGIMQNKYKHIADTFKILDDDELAVLSKLIEKIVFNIIKK
jgi:DNA-binding MarR family transcriptional regulator